MPDALHAALQTEGIGWLLLGIVAAGLVRGFSGFGSAMIIMPVASAVLSPFAAITFLVVVELVGPLPNLRNALRVGDVADTARLALGALVALPAGLAVLGAMSPEIFGWLVSTVVLILLCLLATGYRYGGEMRPPLVIGTGALGGFLCGVAGIPGPPVIMLYMASTKPIAVIRANFLLYLLMVDVMMIAGFALSGRLSVQPILVGLLLMGPYIIANMVGARLFDPAAERSFRAAAYTIIAASAILGLPLWR